MKTNLVNKIREFGPNAKYHVKHKAGKYMAILGLGTLSTMTVLTGCTGAPQEVTYTPAQVQEIVGEAVDKALIEYQEAQKAKADKTQLEKNTAAIETLETDYRALEKTVTEGFAKIPGQLDDALKKYSEEKESEYTGWVYRPGDGWCYDGPQYECDKIINELIRATRYSFTKSLVENMFNWDRYRFKNVFGYVSSNWFDGNTSNKEFESGAALHVDESEKERRFYFRNDTDPVSSITVSKVEDFLQDYFGSHIYDLSRVTIHSLDCCCK